MKNATKVNVCILFQFCQWETNMKAILVSTEAMLYKESEPYRCCIMAIIPWSSEAQSEWPIFQRNPLSSPPPVATNAGSVGLQATA